MNQRKTPREHLVSDQVNAAIIDTLNQQRISDEAMKLAAQEAAFFKAQEQVQQVRDFVGNPFGILGSMETKHGEIAEHVEVGIRNARAALLQQEMPATFDGVGRLAPEDYLINGVAVQSKFINGVNNNLDHVLEHMGKYSNFGRDGSFYHIPKNFYETIAKIRDGLPVDDLSERSKTTILNKIKIIEEESGKSFETVVKPGISDYADVQRGRMTETLNRHEQALQQENEELKDIVKNDHKPSLSGAIQATIVAGAVGGAISLGSALYSKYKQSKNPFKSGFSQEDWKEVGIATAKGSVGGAIAGSAIYLLTNNAALSAPFAGAIVSAAKGVSSLVNDWNAGKITSEEFKRLGLIICADSAIVCMATVAGQTLIPIPILGAVIGSLAGKIFAEFTVGKGKEIAKQMRQEMAIYTKQLSVNYQTIIQTINKEFDRLGKLTEAAFDLKRNTDLLLASVDLARAYGVAEKDIIANHVQLDDFMLS